MGGPVEYCSVAHDLTARSGVIICDVAQRLTIPLSTGYLIVCGFAIAGTLVGQLGATSATTYAANGNGGVETGIYLAILLGFAALSTAYVGRITHRWGRRRVFSTAQVGVAVSWSIVGVVEIVTSESLMVMWLAAPLFGVLFGVTTVVSPFVTHAYLSQTSLTVSMARRNIAAGVGAMLGASLGGVLIHATDPGVGILASGLLTIPLAVFLLARPPAQRDDDRPTTQNSARDLVDSLRSSPQLRRVGFLTASLMICLVPLFTMIVPVLNALDTSPLPSGAGFMLAGVAAGRFFVPNLVRRTLGKQSQFFGAIRAFTWASGFMIVFAVSTMVSVISVDLVVWTLIGVGLGASRFTARALTIGAAADASPPGKQISGMAVLVLIGTVVSPIGMLLWGVSVDYLSSPITVGLAALVILVIAAVLARSRARGSNN